MRRRPAVQGGLRHPQPITCGGLPRRRVQGAPASGSRTRRAGPGSLRSAARPTKATTTAYGDESSYVRARVPSPLIRKRTCHVRPGGSIVLLRLVRGRHQRSRPHARERGGGVGVPPPALERRAGSWGASREPLGCGTPRFLKALRFYCFRHEGPTPLGSISDHNGGPCNERLRLGNLVHRSRDLRADEKPRVSRASSVGVPRFELGSL